MLTLITGAPGAGKTAALVSMLADLGKDRQLWVNGIPDLKIPHVQLDDPEHWYDIVPDGSVIIIDEVQNVWRPSGSGTKLTDSITRLETHRHNGLDFYIITQGPNLVHANVRALVGRHVHLRDIGFMGRWWYEWPETSDGCRTNWKTAPIKKKYKLPSAIFDSYKSSSLHVKPVRSFPWVILVFFGALILASALAYSVYKSMQAKISPPSPAVAAPLSGASGPPSLGTAGGLSSVPVDERVDFTPRLSNRPWTAPAYDSLRVVVQVPHITGAICVNLKCTCYSGAATLVDVNSASCLTWARTRPFNPYVLPETASADKSLPSGRAQPVQSSGAGPTVAQPSSPGAASSVGSSI